MQYVMSFQALLKEAGLQYPLGESLSLNRLQFQAIVQKLLTVEVDEKWYKHAYPDVAKALASGALKSAKEHFVANGYFECRLPKKIVVDEGFYTGRYPEVAGAIREGEFRCAQEHFDKCGFREGAIPFAIR